MRCKCELPVSASSNEVIKRSFCTATVFHRSREARREAIDRARDKPKTFPFSSSPTLTTTQSDLTRLFSSTRVRKAQLRLNLNLESKEVY